MREIKGINIYWYVIFSLTEMLSFMKMSLKVIERSDVTSVKILTHFFQEVNGLVLKFIQKCKGPRTAKPILMKKKIEDLYAVKYHDINININNITET